MKFRTFLAQDIANYIIPILFSGFSLIGFSAWESLADNHWLVPIGWQLLFLGTPTLWFRHRYKVWKKLYK